MAPLPEFSLDAMDGQAISDVIYSARNAHAIVSGGELDFTYSDTGAKTIDLSPAPGLLLVTTLLKVPQCQYPLLAGNTDDGVVFQGLDSWQANYLGTPMPSAATTADIVFAKSIGISYVFDSQQLTGSILVSEQDIADDSHFTNKQVDGIRDIADFFTTDDPQLAGRSILTNDTNGVTVYVNTNTDISENQLEDITRKASLGSM